MFVRSAWLCIAMMLGVFTSQARGQLPKINKCPVLDTAQYAKSYQIAQRVSPPTFANCVTNQLDSLPTSGTDLDKWADFYNQTADIYSVLRENEQVGSPARASYSKTELKIRKMYRETLSSWISASEGLTVAALTVLQTKYAVGVDYEYELILRQTTDGLSTMKEAHQLLVDLDPMHILGKTGTKWAEVVRTCPSWKPADGLTAMDKWCQSNCKAEFEQISIKLSDWMVGKLAVKTATTAAMLKKQNADIAKSCKE